MSQYKINKIIPLLPFYFAQFKKKFTSEKKQQYYKHINITMSTT